MYMSMYMQGGPHGSIRTDSLAGSERLILEPIRRRNILEVLASLDPLGPDDEFPDVDNTLLPAKAIDL